MTIDRSTFKQTAAEYAVHHFVRSNMVIGLGSGSTAIFATRLIGHKLQVGDLTRVVGIPSSVRTEIAAREVNIPLTTFGNHPQIDVTIDGADEIDPQLNLIKGGGGALLREKMLAQASQQVIIVADDSKQVDTLGSTFKLPIEVVPFGWEGHIPFIASLGGTAIQRITEDGNPKLTDQGNFVLDCDFGGITDPNRLALQLAQRAGIVEHGLFINLATLAIVAREQGITQLGRGA